MAALETQVIYGLAGDPKPVPVGEGDNQKNVISAEDFSFSLRSTEETIGQGITQRNAETNRQINLINSAGLTELTDLGGGAALADAIAAINSLNTQVNSIITILTNLNITPKE